MNPHSHPHPHPKLVSIWQALQYGLKIDESGRYALPDDRNQREVYVGNLPRCLTLI